MLSLVKCCNYFCFYVRKYSPLRNHIIYKLKILAISVFPSLWARSAACFFSTDSCFNFAAFSAGDVGAYPGVLGPWYAAIAALGMIFAAMYLLIMVGKMVFGPERIPAGSHDDDTLSRDLGAREITVLAPLAVLCIVLGVQPWLVIEGTSQAVADTLAVYQPILEQVTHQAGASVTNALAGGTP